MKRRVVTVLGVTSLVMLTAAGCGKQTVEERIQDAMKKAQEFESVEYVMDMDINMKVSSQGVDAEIPLKMKSTVSMIQKPIAAKIDMNMDMGELGSQKMEMYMEEADGSIKMYTGADGQWMQQEMDMGDIAQYDAAANIELYMKNMSSFEEKGTEKVGDQEAVRIDGVISGDSMEEVMQSTGVMDTLSGMTAVEQELVENMYSELGDLKMSIWLSKDNCPLKYEMDMSEMMSKMMESLTGIAAEEMGDTTIDISKALISLEMTSFDKVTKIDIPDEARQGEEM